MSLLESTNFQIMREEEALRRKNYTLHLIRYSHLHAGSELFHFSGLVRRENTCRLMVIILEEARGFLKMDTLPMKLVMRTMVLFMGSSHRCRKQVSLL